MKLPKLRRVFVTVAVSVLSFSFGWLAPAAAQDVEPGAAPGALCAAGFPSATLGGGLLPPAPIEQQTCGPCILDTCAGVKVRCTFVGCFGDCCEYSCVCDETCTSGTIPGGACPLRLPICKNCGNGTIEIGEDCDGTNLNGQTCESQGYHGGTLTCNGDCTFNFDQCIPEPVCPNGTCEWGEDCETCPSDCPGQSTGKPENRFCCGNGVLEQAEGNGSICDGNP